MPPDDLNAPLGQHKDATKAASRRTIGVPQALAALLALSGLAVAGWAIFANDPLGGEPVVVVATGVPGGGGAEQSHHDGEMSDAAVAAVAAKLKPKPAPPDGQIVTIIDGSSGKREEVVLPPKPSVHDPSAARRAADPRLLQTTKHGAIPVIGSDGARASTVYAQPRALAPALKDLPRIAVIVTGLGISAGGTADSLKLPAGITFALSPYAADLGKLAEHARADGHEILLQVPMEPFDYPDNDPGPQTLLTSLPAEQNIDRLHWTMARAQAYVGLIGYMGARFATSDQALAPVLHDVATRGLIYVDDGASVRSAAGQIAGQQNLAFARTDVVLDAQPTPQEIDRALARLELAARQSGRAVGLAAAQPATVERIARWAKQVESRGFVLVPISMAVPKPARVEAKRN